MHGENALANDRDRNVCIVGLGYVGLTLAAVMADAGFRVFGVEKDAEIRARIASGRAHFYEPGLDQRLSKHLASGDLECSGAMPSPGRCSVFVIAVGTPVSTPGEIAESALGSALRQTAQALADGDIVILRSTVEIGTTRQVALPILRDSGRHFGLAICPERTAEGAALEELVTLPQIVSGLTAEAARRAADVFAAFAPEILRVDSLEAAEMVKLVNNGYRDVLFGLANEIAGMCDALGLSATEVIAAACRDYPRADIPVPGTVGGPCLSKDPHLLAGSLRDADYTPSLVLAAREVNEGLPLRSLQKAASILDQMGCPSPAKIAILGMAFKGRPETDDTRGSLAAPLIAAIRTRWPKAEILAYDTIVPKHRMLECDVTVAETLEAAFEGASLVLIQNNHSSFDRMPIEDLSASMADPALIYDFWSLFQKPELPAGRHYCSLGNPMEPPIGARKDDRSGRPASSVPPIEDVPAG